MNTQQALYEYILHIGDNNLILGHRLSEWCGHGPVLEEDIALTNAALDLIGQARILLDYAGKVEGNGRSEDDLAYLRDVWEFKNVLLVEQPNGDYAHTMTRQFFYAAFTYPFYKALTESTDETLKAFAHKALKEATYHLRHSSDWVIRLGDGTEESHQRMQEAVNELWMYTGELMQTNAAYAHLQQEGIVPDMEPIKAAYTKKVEEVLAEATLKQPDNSWMISGGIDGKHSEHLGFILADMQYLQRAYPGAEW